MKNVYPVFTAVVLGFALFCFAGTGTGGMARAEQKTPTPTFAWVKKAGGDYIDHGSSIALDSKNNVYVTGFFEKYAAFGETTLYARGQKAYDIFIAQYDKTGNLKWVQRAGGDDFDEGTAITTDSQDHVYVTGYFKGTAAFGKQSLTSYGNRDVFIAKINSAGDWLWVKQAGSSGEDNSYSITTDSMDRIIVTGSFTKTAAFADKKMTSKGISDIFVARYDNKGNLLWVRQAGGASFDHGYSAAADQLNNVYVTGYFKGTAGFGDTSVTSYGDHDIFIAKYNSNGELIWLKQAGGSYWDYGYAITTDNMNNVIVTGFIFDKAQFGDISITASTNNHNDVFIAKYDSKGTLLWVQQAGGTSYDRGKGIAVDNNGNIYIAGHFKTDTTFDRVSLNAYGQYDIFIAKYDARGNFAWLKQAGGAYYDEACSITSNGNNGIYITGDISCFSYNCAARFGNLSLTPKKFDMFVAKIVESR